MVVEAAEVIAEAKDEEAVFVFAFTFTVSPVIAEARDVEAEFTSNCVASELLPPNKAVVKARPAPAV